MVMLLFKGYHLVMTFIVYIYIYIITGLCTKLVMWMHYIDGTFLSGHVVMTNLRILCLSLILSIPVFSLPVIISQNVFSFFMFPFMWTIQVAL